MSNQLWIKIGLIGTDPQLGTLQGRIYTDKSFSETINLELEDDAAEAMLDSCIHMRVPFKLFDPIIFRAQRGPNGEVLLGASALADSMPPIATRFLTVNPSSIAWWAPIENTEEWDRVVASTIDGINLAGSGELNISMPQDPNFLD